MEDKKDKDLLNYVKNYNIPKKEPKYEDRHVVIPLPSKKRNKNENKETKKKSSKLIILIGCVLFILLSNMSGWK